MKSYLKYFRREWISVSYRIQKKIHYDINLIYRRFVGYKNVWILIIDTFRNLSRPAPKYPLKQNKSPKTQQGSSYLYSQREKVQEDHTLTNIS